ncbi:hypothetical protein IPZ58_28270 [Streptomyces roseoverticillatus]|uniref:hypothetical protein n=1 Tax=Streptomyces roseoverticillatus TaxID=66429 RepID=UPI001F23FC93|nr:hypothetical protein [Streptomyces roseoverticillatus]MCF3105457.1 hypothetical protein [Streptomyces roseoverticillatus]
MSVTTNSMSKAEVQNLLGVTAFGLWRIVRKYEDFPAPERSPRPSAAKDEETWDGTKIYRWTAKTPEFEHRGAMLLRPVPEDLAPGKWAGHQDTVQGPALDWHTALGTIRLVHTSEDEAASAVATDLAQRGNPDGVTTVCALYGDLGISGPALIAADTAHPAIEYEARWGVVARLAGQHLPWWPHLLRRPQIIRQWHPGAPALTVEVPSSDQEHALRRAAANTTFDTATQAVLTDMANALRNERVSSVERENETFGSTYGPHPIVIAAQPDSSSRPLPAIDDRQALIAGWKTIAASSHPDAVTALELALARDPRLLPFGAPTRVVLHPGRTAEQWARRLTLCDPTAAHAALAGDNPVDAFFTDPLTDMPALRTTQDGIPTLRFNAPLALPATDAELTSVILDGTVWIKTSDGQVHPAPCTPNEHLWWGDGWGDKPTEAATVITTLLDNLGAAIDLHEHRQDAPRGLAALLERQQKDGPIELPRHALLHARMTTPPKN